MKITEADDNDNTKHGPTDTGWWLIFFNKDNGVDKHAHTFTQWDICKCLEFHVASVLNEALEWFDENGQL